MGDIGSYAVLGQLGLGVAFALLGFSMGGVWNTLFMLQFVQILPVMRIYMPSCVKYFFDKFKWANMESDFIAHWFRHTTCGTYVPPELAAPLYTFEKTGFENKFFMSNIADMLSLIVAAMVLVSLFAMLRLMIPGI